MKDVLTIRSESRKEMTMRERDTLTAYFDKEGKLAIWPSRKNHHLRIAGLKWIAEAFEIDTKYREKEVNEVIKSRISFGDHVLIRRELFDLGLIDRELDGSFYWRKH
jgi:hypothetical protein